MSVRGRGGYDDNKEIPCKAGSLGNLYDDHEIDEGLVNGPVEIWKKVTLKFITPKTKPKEPGKTIEKDIKQLYSCEICKTRNMKHYCCALCDDFFFSMLSMTFHMEKHRRPKNTCKIYNKEFKNANRLEQHMITNSNNQPFSCNICNKSYKRKSTLYAHKYTHENKKPYKCKHCRKSFAFKGQLQAHSRIHTGKKTIQVQNMF